MDSREPMHHQPPPHHHHHHHGIVVGSTSAPPPTYLSSHGGGAPGPSSGGLMQQQPRFPFNPLSSLSSAAADQHPHHPGLDAGVFEGSGGGGGSGFSIDSGKKKRGRPRKYNPDGEFALGLGPTGSGGGGGGGSGSGHFDGMSTPGSGDKSVKKHRGRPPGVGRRQMDALGAGGIGFTPHVIHVKAGEDIASKIMSFIQQGPRTVCILSANGAVSKVTLRQPSMSVGTVSCEGHFEIISISGSFIFPEEDDDGARSTNDSLSVSLAGSNGQVLGGVVAGLLMAAGPVQVVVGSFIASGSKPKSFKSERASLAAQGQGPNSQMLNFSAAAAAAAVSPSSQGGSGESSNENGDSPGNWHPPGIFNDPRQPGSHGIQMYHHLWAGQASQ